MALDADRSPVLQKTATETLLGQLDGAVILHAQVEEGEGVHFELEDGRTLIIAGSFAIALTRLNVSLH